MLPFVIKCAFLCSSLSSLGANEIKSWNQETLQLAMCKHEVGPIALNLPRKGIISWKQKLLKSWRNICKHPLWMSLRKNTPYKQPPQSSSRSRINCVTLSTTGASPYSSQNGANADQTQLTHKPWTAHTPFGIWLCIQGCWKDSDLWIYYMCLHVARPWEQTCQEWNVSRW